MKSLIEKVSFWKRLLSILFLILYFQTYSFAADVTLQWDANTESDLVGYKLYYGSFAGIPYDGKGIDQGNSPIIIEAKYLTDPLNPIFTLTGIDLDNYYYLALTAYDSEGLESGFSNEVTIAPGDSSFNGNGINILSNQSADSGCFVKTVTSTNKSKTPNPNM